MVLDCFLHLCLSVLMGLQMMINSLLEVHSLFLFFFSLSSSTLFSMPLILKMLRLHIREINSSEYGTMCSPVEDVIHFQNWHSILVGHLVQSMKITDKMKFPVFFFNKNVAAAHGKLVGHEQL